jgi:hypothetical protein
MRARKLAAEVLTGVNEYITELAATIQRLHCCQVSHTRTETVREVVGGQVVFEGNVEVFALLGHDRALRCYAWGHLEPKGLWEVSTVLAIPPVISAETAVLAAIAAKITEQRAADGNGSQSAPESDDR